MFYHRRNFEELHLSVSARFAIAMILATGVGCFPAPAAAQQPGQKTFPFAAEASGALVAALQADDQPALLSILGPDAKDIISSGDAVEDKKERDDFVQKYHEMHRIVTEPDAKTTTLYIGPENWPYPIPLVQKSGNWYFDTPEGKQEILYRRVGENEIAVIQVCRELVDAEKEYSSQPHDGGSSHRYAQKIFSDPGKHNGLYWPVSSGGGESPIGPLVATAAAEGYTKNSDQQHPFHGYYFRVLTVHGTSAPGGETNGFAFLAYPADYRSSGVMTFIVDQNGIVYEKDLGRHTAQIAKTLPRSARDATWRRAD